MDIRQYEPLWGTWHTTKAIGAGSYGIVYRAEQEVLGQKYVCAVKYISIPKDESELLALRAQLGTEEDAVIRDYLLREGQSVIQEYNIQKQFSGRENFVQVYDIYAPVPKEEESPRFDLLIRMELLNSIDTRFRAGMTADELEKEALHLGLDICHALVEMHKKNYLHRDIKPQNILVSDEGIYKVADFGAVKKIGGAASFMSLKGTMDFMPPEVLTGKPVGFYSDVYSLGLVLHYVLNRCRLPLEETAAGKAENPNGRRFAGETLPAPVDATPKMAAIILKACSFDPKDRYADAEALYKALEALRTEKENRFSSEIEQCMADLDAATTEQEVLRVRSRLSGMKDDPQVQAGIKACDAKIAYLKIRGNSQTGSKGSTVPNDQGANTQLQAGADTAESIRSKLYDSAVRAMHDAGSESSKWDIARKMLAAKELDGYRDVEQLRKQVELRYHECAAKERAARRQEMERKLREVIAAAAKRIRKAMPGILAAVLVVAVILILTRVIIPGSKYRNALALQQGGQYDEAIAVFEALNGYSDSAAQVTETKYLKAKALYAEGDYAGAIAIFNGIRDYKDADVLLETAQIVAACDEQYSEGKYVVFGTYPQTAEGGDSTPIEWQVLARDGSQALLLSRYGLDVQPYNQEYTDITWEDCTLRIWLKDTFLNEAFTAEEQAGIVLKDVDNSSSQGYSGWRTSGGNTTQDRIFLLSYAEANRYLGVTLIDNNNTKSRLAPTAYAVNQDAWISDTDKSEDDMAAGWWWLRSPGAKQNIAADVQSSGSLGYHDISNSYGCVRPAVWINLESGIF